MPSGLMGFEIEPGLELKFEWRGSRKLDSDQWQEVVGVFGERELRLRRDLLAFEANSHQFVPKFFQAAGYRHPLLILLPQLHIHRS
jgi:hypothetical protein